MEYVAILTRFLEIWFDALSYKDEFDFRDQVT